MPSLRKPSPPQEIFKLPEVADYLRLSASTVRKLVKRKGIPFTTIGVQYRFKKTTIDAWMERNTKKQCKVLL